MILPTKRLGQDRALLAIGGDVLFRLNEPKTVSRLWSEVKADRSQHAAEQNLTYDWFVLALDLLYAVNAIELERGRIQRVAPP
jgi:hypothetical protein